MDFCSAVATAELLLQPWEWWKCAGVATEYSHWINMKTIPDEFVQRVHEVTSILVELNKPSAIKFEIYPTSYQNMILRIFFRKVIDTRTFGLPKDTFWTYVSLMQELFLELSLYSLRVSPGYTIDKYSGGFPFPPSLVLVVMSELSDQMTFLEGYKILHRRATTLPELLGKAEMWFI
ncbi:hypothetical protein HPG69_001447 [Diceros bicornis minor]|uniref:Uncharacterized protein n=1 Tax=Diceros bicornis minor TaxID=77932 RepID=A0A7J7FGL8_DICBM|nr:hypothetical protein HPG69_001447 [Diceros bicornis minor]